MPNLQMIPGDDYDGVINAKFSYIVASSEDLTLGSAVMTVVDSNEIEIFATSTAADITDLTGGSYQVDITVTAAESLLLANYVGNDAIFYDVEVTAQSGSVATVARGRVEVLSQFS
jgi:transketolase